MCYGHHFVGSVDHVFAESKGEFVLVAALKVGNSLAKLCEYTAMINSETIVAMSKLLMG